MPTSLPRSSSRRYSNVPRRHEATTDLNDVTQQLQQLDGRITTNSGRIDELEPGVAARHIAAQDLGGHRVVYLDSDGLRYAEPSDPTARAAIGLTRHAGLTGSQVVVQTHGDMIEPSWTWTVGEPLWLAPGGTLTQTPPTSGVMVQIAVAKAPTRVHINVLHPFYFDGA